MSISFGIPKREVINKERYPDTPVLTMELVQDKGFNRRFSLNQRALELLDIIPGTSNVVFAFDTDTNRIYITKMISSESVMVGKNQAFSNKKYYEYIGNMKKLDLSQDTYFELKEPIDIMGHKSYELVQLEKDLDFQEELNPVVSKEIEHLIETEQENNYVPEEDIPFEPHGHTWNG